MEPGFEFVPVYWSPFPGLRSTHRQAGGSWLKTQVHIILPSFTGGHGGSWGCLRPKGILRKLLWGNTQSCEGCSTWWRTPWNSALGRQRQGRLCEFHNSQGYTETLPQNKKKDQPINQAATGEINKSVFLVEPALVPSIHTKAHNSQPSVTCVIGALTSFPALCVLEYTPSTQAYTHT